MVGPVSDWLVPRCRNTLLSMSITEAASLHYQIIDGKVSGGKSFMCRDEVFGLARTRLTLQQPDSDVRHPKLLLALRPKWIQGLPLREGAVDHLKKTSAVTFQSIVTAKVVDFYGQKFPVGKVDVSSICSSKNTTKTCNPIRNPTPEITLLP